MSEQESPRHPPAYVPYDTFEHFIGTLKQVGVTPDGIDRSHMPRMSGALQSHLVAALKFLQLTTPTGQRMDALDRLVQAHGTDGWKASLAAVVEPAYAPIIGDLNLKTGTARKLREKFKEASGLDGATLDKAIRFYLKALKATGAEVSPHFFVRKAPAKRASSNGRTKAEPPRPSEGEPPAEDQHPSDSPPPRRQGTITIQIPFPVGRPQGSIIVPQDLKEADMAMVEAALVMVRAYAKANSGTSGTSET